MNTYYDARTGEVRRIRPSLAAAQREIDRYNLNAAQIEATENKLQMLYERQRLLSARAFAALPDGHGILMGKPWKLGSSETGEAAT